jgi:hypothetical protein
VGGGGQSARAHTHTHTLTHSNAHTHTPGPERAGRGTGSGFEAVGLCCARFFSCFPFLLISFFFGGLEVVSNQWEFVVLGTKTLTPDPFP